jgi:cytosolic phospholipase A2
VVSVVRVSVAITWYFVNTCRFTPYEFFCEEVGAGIPIWAMGRQFKNGKTVWRKNGLALPETKLSLLMGIWGSAFCATLSHYYKEIRPVMKGLAGFAGIDQMIADRDEDLIKVHPINPAAIPNFAHGMKGLLPPSCPKSLLDAEYLQLMDAGMSNNLPIYPLLRPGRNIDVVIAFDASADVKTDNWLSVVDGYAKQRNITGWPVGAGWPSGAESQQQIESDLERALPTDISTSHAERKLEESKRDPNTPKELGYCNVWVGSTAQRTAEEEPPPSTLIDDENWNNISDPDAGITVIYFPLLSNPEVPGVDPKTTDYLSTWNFVYSPEEVDNVIELARANFATGKEQTRRTIRAVYDRKKKLRLEREQSEKETRRAQKLRSGIILGRKLGQGDHGDHFS